MVKKNIFRLHDMLQYFLKKRLRSHDLNNNLKLESLVRSHLLSQQTLTSVEEGVGNNKPDKIVVSLTSFGRRIHDVYLCVESLFQQSLKADAIALWLSRENFPDEKVPEMLLKQQQRGLQIFFVDGDLGSYKKYFYAFNQFPDSLIITVDDDVLYPPDMVDMLYQAYLREPSYIHCHRAHQITLDKTGNLLPYEKWRLKRESWCGFSNTKPSHMVFPTGVGGVLYHPHALHKDAFDSEKFLKICPDADDIWLKAMSIRQGTKAVRVSDHRHWRDRFLTIPGAQGSGLKNTNLKRKSGNDCKLKKVFSEYQLLDKLQ
ncbi:glycosyltransferase family 2 protein [Microbulbifer sp. SSSA007]|uniref:glycosyltransferase family 2 protein n=1 Tax=Microbulbifer sp. SSSA007 TaxID=3243379 RepID=UPI004039CFEA